MSTYWNSSRESTRKAADTLLGQKGREVAEVNVEAFAGFLDLFRSLELCAKESTVDLPRAGGTPLLFLSVPRYHRHKPLASISSCFPSITPSRGAAGPAGWCGGASRVCVGVCLVDNAQLLEYAGRGMPLRPAIAGTNHSNTRLLDDAEVLRRRCR